MNQVVEKESNYWDNSKLATCFFHSMSNLWIGLQKEIIKDVFYPDVRNSNTNTLMMIVSH